MALDLTALRAKIAAQKEAANVQAKANVAPSVDVPSGASVNSTITGGNNGSLESPVATNVSIPTVNAPATLGTGKTSEIDHMDFLAKMNSLSEAIHKQHPTMPVLLMQIHKQLRSDPELVTTLDETAIGIIVKGLQVQTKTELVVAAVSSKGTKKKSAVSVDML